ncbi:MAG: acylphosphatase [Deltaproteobacteria bacterium]
MDKRIHAYFNGHVQGVGFRFTAVHIARETKISGWVRNLDDGRVEIVAEGRDEDLKNFLSGIQSRFSRYVRDVDAEWTDATGEFSDFGVRF